MKTGEWLRKAFDLKAKPICLKSGGEIVLLSRKLAPSKAEIYVSRSMEVANANSLRHIEGFYLALDKDVAIRVHLVHESNNTFFETDNGVRLAVDDSNRGDMDQAAIEWFGAFRKAVRDAKSKLPFPASSELQIDWSGELRMTPQGMMYWTPDSNPDFSSVEGLCDATVAVWSVMEG